MLSSNTLLLSLILGHVAHAGPVSLAEDRLPERAASDCTKPHDDASEWVASGAEAYLTEYLKEHGPENWINHLNDENYGDHTDNSTLNCAAITSTACGESHCSDYKRREYFIIRLMAQRTHDLFEAAHDALLSQTILDTLNLNKIVQDFKLPEPDESPFDKLLDGLH